MTCKWDGHITNDHQIITSTASQCHCCRMLWAVCCQPINTWQRRLQNSATSKSGEQMGVHRNTVWINSQPHNSLSVISYFLLHTPQWPQLPTQSNSMFTAINWTIIEDTHKVWRRRIVIRQSKEESRDRQSHMLWTERPASTNVNCEALDGTSRLYSAVQHTLLQC